MTTAVLWYFEKYHGAEIHVTGYLHVQNTMVDGKNSTSAGNITAL